MKKNRIYIVRSGDSLESIAKDNNCSLEQLYKTNGLSSNMIYPGQKLTIERCVGSMSVKMDCWVFECKVCGHLIFIKKDKGLRKLENYQCPGCQALNDRNWVFVGEGNSKTFEWK